MICHNCRRMVWIFTSHVRIWQFFFSRYNLSLAPKLERDFISFRSRKVFTAAILGTDICFWLICGFHGDVIVCSQGSLPLTPFYASGGQTIWNVSFFFQNENWMIVECDAVSRNLAIFTWILLFRRSSILFCYELLASFHPNIYPSYAHFPKSNYACSEYGLRYVPFISSFGRVFEPCEIWFDSIEESNVRQHDSNLHDDLLAVV